MRKAVAFKESVIGTNSQEIPLHHQQPEPLIQVRRDPYFHAGYAIYILALLSQCHMRNRN